MSFTRFLPKRASTRKRKYTVASPSNESREQLDYDGTKNCILEIENDLQQLRKKLKSVKGSSKTRYGHDLSDVERHVKQGIHQHMQSLNQHFGLKYDEVNELEREIGNCNNDIEEFNINLKEKDRQITSLHSKLKDKDKNVKALQQQFSEAEAERKTQNSKLVEQEKSFSFEITSLQKQLEQRERDIESFSFEITSLQKQLEQRERDIESFSFEITSLQKQLKQRERDIESCSFEITSLQKQLEQRERDIESLQKSKEEEKNTIAVKLQKNQEELMKTQSAFQGEKQHIVHGFQEDLKNKDNTINKLQDQLRQVENFYKCQIEQIYAANTKEITRLNEQLKQCEIHYKSQIQQIYTEHDQNISRFKSEASSRENTIKHLFSELEVARAAKEDERKQKDDVLTRLSAVAGDRLRNNNPGITDLSDPNRPMKIAEKFTEMYDNDWTDSMEALEDLNIPEEKCVEILLHLVTDSYEECGRMLHDLNGYLVKAVIVCECEDETNQPNGSSPSNDGLPAEITKPIKDLRRKLADNSVLTLQKKLPQHLQNKRGITEDQMKACKKFIEDCIRYTWVMQMQDPPVHIEWEFSRESTIDTNILRSYTRAGDKVDFVVWPVLYLHKDGPVLNKGVVQPIPHAQ